MSHQLIWIKSVRPTLKRRARQRQLMVPGGHGGNRESGPCECGALIIQMENRSVLTGPAKYLTQTGSKASVRPGALLCHHCFQSHQKNKKILQTLATWHQGDSNSQEQHAKVPPFPPAVGMISQITCRLPSPRFGECGVLKAGSAYVIPCEIKHWFACYWNEEHNCRTLSHTHTHQVVEYSPASSVVSWQHSEGKWAPKKMKLLQSLAPTNRKRQQHVGTPCCAPCHHNNTVEAIPPEPHIFSWDDSQEKNTLIPFS